MVKIEPGILLFVEIPRPGRFSLTKILRLEQDGIVVLYHTWTHGIPDDDKWFSGTPVLMCEERKGSYDAWQSWLTSLNSSPPDELAATTDVAAIRMITAVHGFPICKRCFPELL